VRGDFGLRQFVVDTGARKTRFNWALGKQLGLDPRALLGGDIIQGATNDPIETKRGSAIFGLSRLSEWWQGAGIVIELICLGIRRTIAWSAMATWM
jgi:hypothetical protein